LKVNEKEIIDKIEIACKFNTFYLAKHKLEPNQKKNGKIHRKQKGANRGDGHLVELLTEEFIMEVKGSNKKKFATRSNQDLTKHSQNLLKTLVQKL
jgi:hypothetical protein